MPMPRSGGGAGYHHPAFPDDVPYPAFMLRIADKYRRPLHEIDEWSLDDLLDERDVILYLHDVDNPPQRPR